MFYDCIKEEPEEDEESCCGALLSINVRFSGGHKKTLSIYENDIIEEKVERFCSQHLLDDKVKEMLTQQVISKLENQIIELEQSQKNTQSSSHSSTKTNDLIENQFKQSFGDCHQQYYNNENNDAAHKIKAEIKEIKYPKLGCVIVNNKQSSRNNYNIDNCNQIKKDFVFQKKSHSNSNSHSKSKDKKSVEKIKKTQLKKSAIPIFQSNQTNNNHANLKTIQLPKKKLISDSSNSISLKRHPLSPFSKQKQSLGKSHSPQSLAPSKKSFLKSTKKEKKRNQIKISPLKNKTEYTQSLEIIQMKIIKYKEIFDIFDSDKDGLISSKNINLSTINQELLKAFTPILGELQKKEIKMNFKEFCIRVDKILLVRKLN